MRRPQTNIALDDDQKRRWQAHARSRHLTLSAMVREYVEHGIDEHGNRPSDPSDDQ
jgi:predicted DNA-binding protein